MLYANKGGNGFTKLLCATVKTLKEMTFALAFRCKI